MKGVRMHLLCLCRPCKVVQPANVMLLLLLFCFGLFQAFSCPKPWFLVSVSSDERKKRMRKGLYHPNHKQILRTHVYILFLGHLTSLLNNIYRISWMQCPMPVAPPTPEAEVEGSLQGFDSGLGNIRRTPPSRASLINK